MTAATPGPSAPNIFSSFSNQSTGLYATRREAFAASLLGQAAILAVIIYIYLAGSPIGGKPPLISEIANLKRLPIIYSGSNGGGGGNFDPLPASTGNLPQPALVQIVPPTVMHPTAIPKLPVPQSIEIAPDVKLPQGGIMGDPLSKFGTPSDGPGGPGGNGKGCCDGSGDSVGPHAGSGPPGIYPAGRNDVTVPVVIYNPEPAFSDEARKAQQQGLVSLILVVGADGRTSDIHVRQSLGMGLDEKAIEAVSRWRFRPATFHGQPVATRVEVEVDFHLY